ncbi:MAG: UDP-galactopyranose mutase, partial [Muribaculaceae bacterium]|nr:UDP-galactopyranose mutase [Muribaculaceae bacterium]
NIANINVHYYGAHIFHTSNREIWDMVNQLVPFNRYTNSPVAIAPDGRLYNLPFNMNTFRQMWGCQTPQDAQQIIDQQRQKAIESMRAQSVISPRNLEEQALSMVGYDIYTKLIEGYTQKQWGRKCDQLPAFIIKRLPLRMTFDNNYFNDMFQGIPIGGYNPLIEKMLNGSDVRLGIDFFSDRYELKNIAKHIVYTGPIDAYFDYRYGQLEYRSVRFETSVLPEANHQGCAVVNYTSADIPYTRIIEHKHFESFGNDIYSNPQTVITHEYPSEWHRGIEPFYPINDNTNQILYKKYLDLANQESNVIFGGRLAEYRYYDMAPTIEQAINSFHSIMSHEH